MTKKTPTSPPSTSTEDFEVIIPKSITSSLDSDTDLITSAEVGKQWLQTAMFNFNNNYHQYSTYLNENAFGTNLITDTELDILSQNPQNDLLKVQRINNIARFFINKDDLIGKVYETIESNVNTEYKLSYKDYSNNKSRQKIQEKVQDIIEDFNSQINIKSLLRKVVPLTYSEGNYPMYLRKNNKGNYVVDYYPLGVTEVSDYEVDGEPYLLFNITELKNRLQKVNKKNKDGTFMFFKDIDEEIKNNYPPEVYSGFTSKNQYVKLDIKNSGILRINNMNRKYGVTPIFRTFKAASTLETFDNTDKINAKSKGKKIIFQKLRKEIMGLNADRQAFEEMAYAHDALMSAWKSDTVVYTAPAWVESLQYVEVKTENTNIDSKNYYRTKIMSNLGISFLSNDSKATLTSSQISIKELMKMINKITEGLESILEKWYKVILIDNNIDLIYCPTIKIIDSELQEMSLRIELAQTLFDKFGMSYRSAFEMLNCDFENEKVLRKIENEENLDEEVFYPRLSAFTVSGKDQTTTDDTGGRPPDEKSKNVDRQVTDKNRVKSKKEVK